jgi:hypothetical protein
MLIKILTEYLLLEVLDKKIVKNLTRASVIDIISDSGFFSGGSNVEIKRREKNKNIKIRIKLNSDKDILNEHTVINWGTPDTHSCFKYVFRPFTFYRAASIVGISVIDKILPEDCESIVGSDAQKLLLFEKYRYIINFTKKIQEYLVGNSCFESTYCKLFFVIILLIAGVNRHGLTWVSDSRDKQWDEAVINELRTLEPEMIQLLYMGGRHFIHRTEDTEKIDNFVRILFFIQYGSRNREVQVIDFQTDDQPIGDNNGKQELTHYTEKLTELSCKPNTLIIVHNQERKIYLLGIVGKSTNIRLLSEIIDEKKKMNGLKRTMLNYPTVIIDSAHQFGYEQYAIIIASLIGKMEKLFILGVSDGICVDRGEAFKDFCRVARYYKTNPYTAVNGIYAKWNFMEFKGEAEHGVPKFKLIGYTTKKDIKGLIKSGGLGSSIIICSEKNYMYWKSIAIFDQKIAMVFRNLIISY